MVNMFMTGGNGRLGRELKTLIPEVIAPSSRDMDITDTLRVLDRIELEWPDLIIHAAAYTDVGMAEKERGLCWKVNVDGTRNVVRAANSVGAKLVHISTDYVFSGEVGNYSEGDLLGPVANYYALTKLVAEEAARASHRHLIIRTSFRPREFQHPVAFDDIFTSQDYVDIIAPMIADAIKMALHIDDEVLHVATERKSVFELAVKRNPSVGKGYSSDIKLSLPRDVSLNCERWYKIREHLKYHDL